MLGGTQSIRAYDLYLSARTLLNGVGRGGNDRKSVQKSLEQIRGAIRLDRKFALGWVLKSRAHDAAQVYFSEKAAYHRRLADEAARRARKLEPNLPQAHLELAFKALGRLKWSKAEAEFAQASGDEMGQHAYLLVNTGLIKPAHDLFLVSQASDPLNANLFMYLIVTYDILGHTTTALRVYDQGKALFANWPAGHFNALVVLWGRRGLDDARAKLLARRIPGPVFRAVNRLYGSPPSVLRKLHQLYADRRKRYADPINRLAIAACAAYFGDQALALDALLDASKAVPLYAHKFWQPLFSKVRKLPKFKRFLRTGGFRDYWQAHGRPASRLIS
jgi:hypothetical protein